MSYEDRFPMPSSFTLKGTSEELGPTCFARQACLAGQFALQASCLAMKRVGLKRYSLKAKLLSFLALSMVMSSQSISCFSGLPVEPVFKY